MKVSDGSKDNSEKLSDVINNLEVPLPKRKRGRPKGSKNGGNVRQWQPKEWRSEYERMIQMDVMGYNQEVIATQIGYTKQQVNNVLNCEQGKVYRKFMIDLIRKQTTEEIPDRLTRLADKALGRIEQIFNKDEVFENAPLAALDKSVDILERLRILGGKNSGNNGAAPAGNVINVNGNVTNNSVSMPVEQLHSFGGALARAEEARSVGVTGDKTKLIADGRKVG
jgi:hypothetical protein